MQLLLIALGSFPVEAWESAAWGLAGGAAAGVASLMLTVANNNFTWWDKKERGPRLFVFAGCVLLGALVAAAASGEMSGPWPAFVIGIGAPGTIRGLLSGVEVEGARKPDEQRAVRLPVVETRRTGAPDRQSSEAADENAR